MTPKEKADELVKRMYAVHSNSASDITLYFAKQCALIAVDEVIAEYGTFFQRIHYWQEVKKEIEKL
jgi:hypothetical protein